MLTIEKIDGTLVAMDADGEVVATHKIGTTKGSRRNAKRWVREIASTHTIEVASAYRLI